MRRGSGRGGFPPVRFALVAGALCGVLACAALLAETAPVARDVPDTPQGSQDEAARDDGVAEGAVPADASGFLDELARLQEERGQRGRAGEDGEPLAASWDDERALPACAQDVLTAYRERPGVSLVTSGYLDLKGDVWGAVLWDGATWVDVVVIAATEQDGSQVRVVRYTPAGDSVS